MTIISAEFINEIIRNTLEDLALDNVEEDNSDLIESIIEVLFHFSTTDQLNSFLDMLPEKYTNPEYIGPVTTEELPDGSLDISVDMGKDIRAKLQSQGMLYSIIKEFCGANTDSDILKLIQLGIDMKALNT